MKRTPLFLFCLAISTLLGSSALWAADPQPPFSAKEINANLARVPQLFKEAYLQLSSQKKTEFEVPELEKKARAALKANRCSLSEKALASRLADEKKMITAEYLDFFSIDFRTSIIQTREQGFRETVIPPVVGVGFFGSAPGTQPATTYYKKKYGNDVTNVLAVTFESLEGKVAAFVPPATKEDLSWPAQWEKVPCTEGKAVDIQFELPITLRGSKHLSLAVIERVFGAPYVIILSKQLTAQIKIKALFDSVVVHELKHYLDYEKDPKVFEHSAQKDEQLLRKVAPLLQVALNDDWARYSQSAPYKAWAKNGARSMLERNAKYSLESLEKLIVDRVARGYEAEASRYLHYYYSDVEYSAHLEQVAFLKSEHRYTVAQVIDGLSNDRLTPNEVKLKSGETVSLSLPPYPLQTRYFTELYEKN